MARLHFQYPPRTGETRPIYPNSIRRYRLQAQLSQQMLADRVGVRRSTVSRWERGMSFPHSIRIFQLARALDTLVEALYPEFYMTRGPSNLTGRSNAQ
jgi:putative transcriptional regulator